MSKDEGGWNSSFSEKPVRSRPRRLVDWINPTGAKKVHSLIDKVYKRKNLEMAWEKVKENRGSGGVDGQSLTAFEAQPILSRFVPLRDRVLANRQRSIVDGDLRSKTGKTPNISDFRGSPVSQSCHPGPTLGTIAPR
jgi:hypothetical protein